MLPVKFDEANCIFGGSARSQGGEFQHEPLPAQLVGDPDGTVVICWQLSDEDRARIAKGGPIWMTKLTYGNALQPVMLTTKRPVF